MPRNMSFILTTEQIRNRTKFVTRRQGWGDLAPGDLVQAVEKCQGIPKGGHVNKLCLIRIVSVNWEPIYKILAAPTYGIREVVLEGFPNLSPIEFVVMYCKHNKVNPLDLCNRIQFVYEG